MIPPFHILGRPYSIASLLILSFHQGLAQIGTITQDISTLQDFSLQPQCVQTCFQVNLEFCPVDMLGVLLGCATMDCSTRSWQAKNDCYCRIDFQEPAQQYLDECIKSSCSVGDPSIAASSAGSIYRRYCEEKGYDTTAPASNEATTTGVAKTTPTTKLRSGPTATSPGNTAEPEPEPEPATDEKAGMSTATLVGVIIGAVLGTIILTVVAYRLYRWHQSRRPKLDPINLAYFNSQGKDEVRPDDSVSHVGLLPPHQQHPPLPPDASLVSGGYASTVFQPHTGRGF